MSFDEEWARLVAAHSPTTPDSTSMRLAGAHAGGGKKTLDVTPSVLRGKASKAEDTAGDFTKADNKALKELGEVKGGLKGFKSASAFAVFEERWKAQMAFVRGMVLEGVAGALRDAAADFKATDKFGLEDGGGGKGGKGKVAH